MPLLDQRVLAQGPKPRENCRLEIKGLTMMSARTSSSIKGPVK